MIKRLENERELIKQKRIADAEEAGIENVCLFDLNFLKKKVNLAIIS